MVTRARLLAILLGAAAAPCAWSFFDDFLGNKLQDGWGWGSELRDRPIYDVSNSNLNVYGVVNDFYGQHEVELESLTETYGADDNYQVDVRVTWEPCEYQLFAVRPWQQVRMWYYVNASRNVRVIAAQVGNYDAYFDAPADGTHLFTLKRIDRRIYAFFDGMQFFAQPPPDFHGEARGIDLEFWSDDRYSFAPIHVDYVSVVPEPATFVQLFVLVGSTHALIRLRRDRRKKDATTIMKR